MSTDRLRLNELLALALPSMAFVILTNAYRSVDQYWVQHVSTDAQAAIGSSTFVLIGAYAVFNLTSVGCAALTARATGANEPARRRSVIGNALAAAAGLSLVVTALGLLGSDAAAGALGLEGASRTECARYLRAISLTVLPLALTPTVDQAFVATGDTRAPMVLQALSLALNAVLTPLFMLPEVFGAPGLGLGVVGAALASNLSRAVSTGIGVVLLSRRVGLRLVDLVPGVELPTILRIGVPASAGVFLYAGVYWAMLRTSISPLGAHVNAALGIGFSALEGFTWPAFYGISLAVSSLVGRALGAGDLDRAKRAVRLAYPMITLAGLGATLAFWLGGRWLTGLFTDDPLVHAAATQYAVILAASQLWVAWEALGEGVLNGAGDTRTVFWASVPLNLLRVPLAWWLALHLGWGAAGVWWAINATTWVKAGLKGLAVARGRWQHLKL